MLYKYVSKDIAIKILRSHKVRFSQLNALNDPYECEPAIKFDFLLNTTLPCRSESNLQELVEEIVGSRKWIFAFPGENAYESFVEIYRVFPELVLKLLKSRYGNKEHDDIEIEIREEIIKTVRLNVGVFSASKKWNNLLMWAHYADEHKGVVVGFDENEIFNRRTGLTSAWKKVSYSKYREAVDVASPCFMHDFLTKKPIDWKYECEYRCIEYLPNLERSAERQKGFDLFLMEIEPRAIEEVYLGSRMKEEELEEVVKEARKIGSNVNIFKTKMSPGFFGLDKHSIENKL